MRTYQHSKGNNLKHAFHGEEGGEHDVQVGQHSFVGIGSFVILKTKRHTRAEYIHNNKLMTSDRKPEHENI